MFRTSFLMFAAALSCFFMVTFAQAQQTTAAPAGQLELDAVGIELGRVLVLAVIIESAMAAVFNWRLYRVLFGGHALRTPIMVLVGWWVVTQFDYDIVARVLHLSIPGSEEVTSNWLSLALSALVIAGGSSGVFAILARLGLRNPLAGTDPPPTLDPTQAWLAIHLTGESGPDTVQVALNDLGTAIHPAIAGTVARRAAGPTLLHLLKDAFGLSGNRFPRSGGRTVKAETDYEIILIRRREPIRTINGGPENDAMSEAVSVAGVYRFAPRAIVDLYLPVPPIGNATQQTRLSDQ